MPDMSIETLLEAAKFLELQAQQQQKTRGKGMLNFGLLEKKSIASVTGVSSRHLHVKTWICSGCGYSRQCLYFDNVMQFLHMQV